jgi:hypothetical protein
MLSTSEKEIYKNWPFRTRYLQKECWNIIKKCILKHQITTSIEFGSGISTILFNNLGIDLISYENDPIYLRIIKSFNLANVEFRLWDNITANIEGSFGLALVDGAMPRINQLYYAQKHSRYVAIDDYTDEETSLNLYPMLKEYTKVYGKGTKLSIFRRTLK